MQTLCLSLDTKLGSYCPLVKKGLEVEKRSPVEKSRESEHLLLCFKLESDTLWEDDNRAASLVPRGHKRHFREGIFSLENALESLSPLFFLWWKRPFIVRRHPFLDDYFAYSTLYFYVSTSSSLSFSGLLLLPLLLSSFEENFVSYFKSHKKTSIKALKTRVESSNML